MGNLGNMMKQAQQLQKKMADVQEKLNSIEVEGVAGGGMVKVTATAKGEIKRINIDESLMKAIRKSEFSQPTPIQAQAIPARNQPCNVSNPLTALATYPHAHLSPP